MVDKRGGLMVLVGLMDRSDRLKSPDSLTKF